MKQKSKSIFNPNIELFDSKKNIRVFSCMEKEKAEEFIENYENPKDIICKFDERYIQRIEEENIAGEFSI